MPHKSDDVSYSKNEIQPKKGMIADTERNREVADRTGEKKAVADKSYPRIQSNKHRADNAERGRSPFQSFECVVHVKIVRGNQSPVNAVRRLRLCS